MWLPGERVSEKMLLRRVRISFTLSRFVTPKTLPLWFPWLRLWKQVGEQIVSVDPSVGGMHRGGRPAEKV